MISINSKLNVNQKDTYENLICICCPKGCHLKVNIKDNKVIGNDCKRGDVYGIAELTNPVRIVTTTVRVSGGNVAMLPVKTKSPIPKNLNFKCIEVLKELEVNAPIHVGDIIYKNILNTGINIVACRNIKLKENIS